MTRTELKNKILRTLGCGMINVELTDDHLNDAINNARDKWITWAVGNATREVWFTLLLKAGQWVYDMPAGMTEIISYKDTMGSGCHGVFEPGGINTLFSMNNYMYNQGVYDGLLNTGGSFGMIDFHIAKDFISTVDKYIPDRYNFTYHRHTNQLSISPVPECGNSLTVTRPAPSAQDQWQNSDTGTFSCSAVSENLTEQTYDSPGFVLIHAYMMEGSMLPSYTPAISGSNDEDYSSKYNIGERYSEYLWDEPWILEYSMALSKITLGYIRRKNENNTALGTGGITLDGSDMRSEGAEEKRELEEQLELKYSYEGYGITMG